MTRTVEEDLTRLLTAWAAGSVATGVLLRRRAPRFARQTVLWGAIDGLVAGVGAFLRAERGPTEAERLRRLLAVNVWLDVGYVATGVAGLVLPAARRRGWHADGAATVVQGGFLLGLDSWALLRLRDGDA